MNSKANHMLKIFQCLSKQTKENKFCDVTLQVEKEIFHAHKAILVSCSEYFMKIFSTTEGRSSQAVVLKDDIGAAGMCEVLKWMYSGELLITEENLFELLRAAHTMQLLQLICEVEAFMLANLSTSNCFRFYKFAKFYSLQKVIDEIRRFFFEEFDAISRQPEAMRFDYDEIARLMTSDELCIQEEKLVFDFLLRWTESLLSERRKYFPHLLRLVRLQFVPIDYIINVIIRHDLVRCDIESRDEVDTAVRYHITPDVTAAQSPRHCWVSNPRSVMLLPFRESHQRVYDIRAGRWVESGYVFRGFTDDTVKVGCALASKHPVAVACGGLNWEGRVSKDATRFDGLRWVEMPPMKKARVGATAVFYNETLYVFGGEVVPISHSARFKETHPNPYSCGFANSYEMFDSVWRDRLHPGTPRSYMGAEVIANKIYLIGGYQPGEVHAHHGKGEIPSKVACGATTLFDPTEESWTEVCTMNTPRASFACAGINSKIFAVGGYDVSNQLIWSNDVEFLDVGASLWITVDMSGDKLVVGPAIGCVVDGKVFLVGSCSSRLNVYDPEKKEIICISKRLPRMGLLIPFVNKMLRCHLAEVKAIPADPTCD